MGKIISNGIEYSGIQGTTVIANPEGSPTDELSSIQIGNDIYSIAGGSSVSWKDITGTLTAGQTSISFTDSSISESSTFDFYTSKFGVNPTDVELVNSIYNFTEFMNGKIIVREHKTDTTDKKLFFIGLEKDATDIDVTDTSLLEYLSDITNDYKKASYSYSNGTTRNGNIGFYNLGNGIKLRSWVIDWTQTLAGTFYGMIDLNETPSSASSTEGQTNTYSDPYDVEGGYSVTLTFDEQSTDLDVKVRITNETN